MRDSHIRPLHRRARICTAALALAAGGCRGVQSALDPAGPAAAAIAQSWWLMALGAALILALVMVLLWHVLSRRPDAPEFAHGTRLIVLGGLALPSLVLIALLIYGTALGRSVTARGAPAEHVIEVEGRQWFWTFGYLGAEGERVAMTVNRLVLPRGRTVEFRVTSLDVIHSFWIPRLGGKIDAIPGRSNTLRLRADAAGPMRGQCAEFCGLEHAHMSFDVVTLPAAQFERWLAGRGRGPLPHPDTAASRAAEPSP